MLKKKKSKFRKKKHQTTIEAQHTLQNHEQAELFRQRQWLKLLTEITFKIRQSLEFKEILRATVTEVQQLLQADRVLIYQIFPDGTGQVITEVVLPDSPEILGLEFPEELFPPEYHQLYVRGEVSAIADVSARPEGLNESSSLNQLWGLLIAYHGDRPYKWLDFEMELMQQLADLIGIALSQAQFRDHLEKAVKVRTVELQEVNHHLQQEICDRQAIERLKDEFIAVVSHELRTPLTSIHSALKILTTGKLGTLSKDGQRILEIADDNTERLVRLVNNVLDLQRIESGEVQMDKQIWNVSTLMMQAIEVMQPMAQDHGVILVAEPVDIHILVDSDYIVQTLTNLISNAIKFSSVNSKVWITVEKRLNSEVLFSVCDEGQGIPLDKLEIIFERFQQVDSSDSRRKGGTGLGLTICRQIIEQHEGKIWAESTLGKGSTFSFTLPLLNL
ncbi:GAF domain-containing protein [Pseudanabaena sp. FACHB-1998]|uniref:sensor histidine kinase n=1 Tax=Pseudanabaena sp. FACHB-1998 TaxID=2692858 RepID=UPI00167FE464|nr:ATP-binding protein [Pseudanabaena sp. FACHB-1998]MBD2177759.1 GAF domain-containing protein [Pseudanabaena sp. FACHB-1998]